MTENDYQLAWGIYAVSALGCLLAWFYFTGWMWRYLREPLRVAVAILLFTPTVVDPARDFYAPAIAMTVMDLLFKVGNDAWRSVADLVMYGGVVFAVYAVFVLLRWLMRGRKAVADDSGGEASTPAAAPAAPVKRREPSVKKAPDSTLTMQQILDAEAESKPSGLVARR